MENDQVCETGPPRAYPPVVRKADPSWAAFRGSEYGQRVQRIMLDYGMGVGDVENILANVWDSGWMADHHQIPRVLQGLAEPSGLLDVAPNESLYALGFADQPDQFSVGPTTDVEVLKQLPMTWGNTIFVWMGPFGWRPCWQLTGGGYPWMKISGEAPKAPTFNHVLTFAFEVEGSTDPDGEDITPARAREALLRRLNSIPDSEILEAVLPPEDTQEEDT